MTELFTKIPHFLIRDSDLDHNELLLYVAMLSRADKRGMCFPSVALLAKEARMSQSTVRRTRERLVARGLVVVTRRKIGENRNDSNLYRVKIPKRPPVDNSGPDPFHGERGGVTEEVPPSHSDWGGGVTATGEEDPLQVETDKKIMRRTQSREPDVHFDFPSVPKASPKQLEYLNDLHIFLTTYVPDPRTRAKWEDLEQHAASELIDTYWQQMDRGRGGMWESDVDEQHSAYPHLSAMGKDWVNRGCVPDNINELKGAA